MAKSAWTRADEKIFMISGALPFVMTEAVQSEVGL